MKILAATLFVTTSLVFATVPAKDAKKAPKPEPAKTALAPAEKKADAKPAPVAAALVGNKDSKVFHRPECKIGAKMNAGNKVSFSTRAEAVKAGYKPCGVCKP
jgi:micrococcal nuclease